MVVADSESGIRLAGPAASFEGGGPQFRNVGWKQGIRIGSARDGSLISSSKAPIPRGWRPTMRATSSRGSTGGCGNSKSGGCVQKWVKK